MAGGRQVYDDVAVDAYFGHPLVRTSSLEGIFGDLWFVAT